jgi:predicted Zn-dependent peptidase
MIKIDKLSNGMIVASDSMSDVESVSVNLLVRVGSRYEAIHINGISHFLEHMAFKGTKTRSALEIAQMFDFIGGDFNAYTTREYTVYTAKILKNDVGVALDIISDIIQNSLYSSEEISKELGVICQEIAASNDTPDDIVFDYFQQQCYPNQAIGRSILGTPDIISKFNKNTFIQYVNEHYFAGNMILSVAGNIEHEQIMDLANNFFGNISPNSVKNYKKANYVGGKAIVEKDLEQVQFLLGFEGFAYVSDNFIPAQLLSVIFGGGMSSRLFQEVREKRGLAYSVSSFNSSYQDSGLFCIYAATSEQHINDLYQIINQQLLLLSANIEEGELTRAKNQFKASILMSKESTSYRSSDLARNLAIYGRVISKEEIIRRIDNVTTLQLANLAATITSGPKQTLALLGEVSKFQHG